MKLSLCLCSATLLAAMSLTAARAQVSLPDYPDVWGVSAPVAGFFNRQLVVGGGCNFPSVAAADGGRKTYYYKMYGLGLRTVPSNLNTGWMPLPPLPQALAYAQSATLPDGRLVVAGGQGPTGDSRRVYVLRAVSDSLTGWQPWPQLPVTVAQGGAACVGRTLYVCGGVQGGGGSGLYALSLDHPERWERRADYPGLPRVQPVVVASGGSLYLMGGYTLEGGRCHLPDDVWRYDPARNVWQEVGRLPQHEAGRRRGLVGASGTALEDGRILVGGGVCDSLFREALEGRVGPDYLRHPAAWYRFSPDLLCLDPQTGQWTLLGRFPQLARAGGVLLSRNDWVFMAVGELKPGVRTPQVTAWPLDTLLKGSGTAR